MLSLSRMLSGCVATLLDERPSKAQERPQIRHEFEHPGRRKHAGGAA
jgi:hypothetical protein